MRKSRRLFGRFRYRAGLVRPNFSMKSLGGFTLVELLVTMAIMVILTSILIGYSHSAEQQLVLIREQAQLANTLLRAKSLSINTFANEEGVAGGESVPCGVGVHFDVDDGSYFIFLSSPSASCADAAGRKYAYNNETDVPFVASKKPIVVDPRVTLATNLTDVVFVPPDPKTYLVPTDANVSERVITFQTPNTNASLQIKINNAGQVTF